MSMAIQKEMPIIAMMGTGQTTLPMTANYNSGMATHKLSVDDLPIELVSGNHWLNWKDLDGQKSPVGAQGYLKGYNDSSSWVPLDTAINRAKGNDALYVGLTLKEGGLAISNGWLWCLDFDGFLDGDDTDDGVNEFLDELGTYVEISPSKTGLKAFFTTDKIPESKSKNNIKFGPSRFAAQHPSVSKYKNREIEVFSRGSFLSVTGDRFDNVARPLRHISESEVDALLDKLHEWAVNTGGVGRDSNPKTTQQTSARSSTTYRKLSIEQLDLALLHIEADTEHTWSDVVNVLARVYGEDARESWHVYSKKSVKYNFDTCEERYNRALRELHARPNGYGIRHLIKMASKHPEWHKVSQQFEYWGDLPTSGSLWEGSPLQLELELGEGDFIDEINRQFAWDSSSMGIYNRRTGMFVRREGFLTNYANRFTQVGSKQVSVGNEWIKSPRRLAVSGFIMSPKEGPITASGALNTWRGYAYDPTEGDVEPFLAALAHLIPNPEDRSYILQWLAKAIQNPETPFKTALAVHGAMQGVGKNTVFEAVGELLNKQHYAVIGKAELLSNFNEWKLDKVLVIGDEVSSGGRSDADKLKGYITSTENYVNPKGLPPIRQPNLIKYILLSNREDIVYLEGEDRRYYVAETNSERMPPEIATQFYKWKKAGGLSYLLHYLLNLDTTGFDPTAPAPMTTAKGAVIDAGKSGLDLWVEEKASELVAKGVRLVGLNQLAETYSRDMRGHTTPAALRTPLKKTGSRVVSKRAVLPAGGTMRVWSLTDHEAMVRMTETELGALYAQQAYY